jgi:membrane protease YdiL (CAAX protease family)
VTAESHASDAPESRDAELNNTELNQAKLPESGLDPTRPGAHFPRRRAMERVLLGPDGVRSGWRAAFYVALFLLFLLGLQLISLLLHVRLVTRADMITPGSLAIQELLSIASALAAALVMSRIEGRRFGDYGMPWREAFRGNFWIGTLWGISGITALMLLMRALGGYSFGALALSGEELVTYALAWAGAFLLVALFEEFFFRGYVQFTLASGMHFWPAALLTSAAFGAVHLTNPGEGPEGAFSVFVTGMFLCLTLRRTGNLWFAIGWHAAWDFGETFLYSVPDSGIVAPGHLLASSFHGPRWLTGGSVGPEGSALDFVVLAALALAFDRVYRPRSARAPKSDFSG